MMDEGKGDNRDEGELVMNKNGSKDEDGEEEMR